MSAIPTNQLLASLSKKTYHLLLPKLEKFDLTYAEIIYEPGDIIKNVHFPESGIVSLLSAVDVHSTLEVGIVGSEGMVGLPLFLGDKISTTQALVQGGGLALKMKAADFLAECGRSDELPKILRLFTHRLMTQISQSAACNRFHSIESRLARWLLMTQDRMRSDDFRITQDFLSNMLGVRREAVNKAASALQHVDLISYNRGQLSVLNRKNLAAKACLCYPIISRQPAI